MAGITSTLIASITSVDPNSAQPITRNIGNPSLAGQVGDFTSYQMLVTAALDVVLGLPSSPAVYCVYIKNLNAPGGGNLTVKATPQGGGAATLTVLAPGGVFMVWNPVNTVVTSGFSSITLNPSAGNTPVEYYLGA